MKHPPLGVLVAAVLGAAVLTAAACAAPTDPPGVWDVAAGAVSCRTTDTGAVTNEDPGEPLVLDLQFDTTAVVTLTDGSTVVGAWSTIPGDDGLPPGAPGREPAIDITLRDYDHAGAMWSSLGLRLTAAEGGDLSRVSGPWQLVSSRTEAVTHSSCTANVVATRR